LTWWVIFKKIASDINVEQPWLVYVARIFFLGVES